jgi:DNA ligase-1
MKNGKHWLNQKSNKLYIERYDKLSEMVKDCKFLKIVESIYKGSDMTKIEEYLISAKEKDWEGVMVRFCDSEYEWKRSKDLLKVKPFNEMDAYIVGFEEGENSNKGRLGAFICEIEHPEFGNLKFKVGGGFTEDERIEFWKIRESLIGRIISVQYFEVTENTTTHQFSVRFPDFLELKESGSEVNN